MTPRELNKDIKSLKDKCVRNYPSQSEEEDVKKEFLRLYLADRKFEYMNKQSVLIMFRLNLRFRFVGLHTFGLHLNLEEL